METLAPAPSMGSRADVSGKSSSGPLPAGVAGMAGGGGGCSGDATLSAVDWLLLEAAGAASAAGCACCRRCWLQPRRAALRTAASEGSWYWQLQHRVGGDEGEDLMHQD